VDIPNISYNALKTLGITQPVAASKAAAPIAAESRASGNAAEKYGDKGKRAPRGEEWVDISGLAKLLAKGRPSR